MEKQRSASTFEMLCDIIDKFAPCMNDYLYAYDITNDVYYISKKALDRFALPSNLFHDVVEAHNVFVYADDIKILSEDLKKMLRGEKESHNIKYLDRKKRSADLDQLQRMHLCARGKERDVSARLYQ